MVKMGFGTSGSPEGRFGRTGGLSNAPQDRPPTPQWMCETGWVWDAQPMSQPLGPQDVTLLGNRVFTELIRLQ